MTAMDNKWGPSSRLGLLTNHRPGQLDKRHTYHTGLSKAFIDNSNKQSSTRKPLKADHSINLGNGSKSNGSRFTTTYSSAFKRLDREKSKSISNISRTQKPANVDRATRNYDIFGGDLSPRSKGEFLLRRSREKLDKLNTNIVNGINATFPRRLPPQPVTSPTQPKSILKGTEQKAKQKVVRSSSLNRGVIKRTPVLSPVRTNNDIPLPGIIRSRRHSIGSTVSLERSLSKISLKEPAEVASSLMPEYSKGSRISSCTSVRRANSKLGVCGLENLGNTCFMNSILQCLSKDRTLREYFCDRKYKKDCKGACRLTNAFGEFMDNIWSKSEPSYISPRSVKLEVQKLAPKFVGNHQHDSQEFLRYLIEGVHDELNVVKTKPTYSYDDLDDMRDDEKARVVWERYLSRESSLIQDLFVGQLRSTLTCSQCGHASVTFDPFWDLSLPIPIKRSDVADIAECFQTFTQEEILDGAEKPTCEKCKKRRKCTKKFLIERCPKVLVIHLKRFAGQRYRTKLSTHVIFPTELDIKQYTVAKESRRYQLFGVSNHIGGTAGGHYTAYCKHPDSGKWNLYNDTRVSPATSSSVNTAGAYVLFYELM